MKKWISFFHWLPPFLLLALLTFAMVWVQQLSVPDFDQEWMFIALILIFGALINSWINKNHSEFTVNKEYFQKSEGALKEKENEEHR